MLLEIFFKVIEIIKHLEQYEIHPVLVDPRADLSDVKRSYGYELSDIKDVCDADCLVLSVAHDEFRAKSLDEWDKFFKSGDNREKVLIDIKSVLDKKEVLDKGYRYWRL